MAGAHLVAILSLSGSVDAAVPALAEALQTAAYDLRLTLAAGFPAVVLVTPEAERALEVARLLRARGHRVALADRTAITPSARMTELRDFQLEPSALRATANGADRLPFSDISALIQAAHKKTRVTTEEVKERSFRPGMALVTGGIVLSKTTTKEVTSRVEERQQVLYIFRRSSAPPWILRERSARYGGLGADLRPTSLDNFATTTRRLRELAPDAGYDDRLLAPRALRGLAEGVEAVDLLAHLLATDIAEAR